MNDTHPSIEALQISLLRKASVARRVSVALSLSQTGLELSRRAIAEANQGSSAKELKCWFVGLHYGTELKERLKRYLELRGV